jgi:hypothetical protein
LPSDAHPGKMRLNAACIPRGDTEQRTSARTPAGAAWIASRIPSDRGSRRRDRSNETTRLLGRHPSYRITIGAGSDTPGIYTAPPLFRRRRLILPGWAAGVSGYHPRGRLPSITSPTASRTNSRPTWLTKASLRMISAVIIRAVPPATRTILLVGFGQLGDHPSKEAGDGILSNIGDDQRPVELHRRRGGRDRFPGRAQFIPTRNGRARPGGRAGPAGRVEASRLDRDGPAGSPTSRGPRAGHRRRVVGFGGRSRPPSRW